MFNKKLLQKLMVSGILIFSFQPSFFYIQPLNVNAANNSKGMAIMCGKEKNGKYICFTNEKSSAGQKNKSYKVNSLKEIVDKLNLYGQPILYEDQSTKKTEILIWEKPSSSKSLSFAVNLKNPKWWSALTTYSWWNSSWESSEWNSFYEESTEEYSEEYSEESSETSIHEEEAQSEENHSEEDTHEEAEAYHDDDHEEAGADDSSDDDNDSSGDDD